MADRQDERGKQRTEELLRIIKGDGKLRLWTVKVMWTGADDLLGDEEQRAYVEKGALEMQRAFILVCMDLGAVVSVGRMLGTQNKQHWLVRANGEQEAQDIVRFSPLFALGMLRILDTDHPDIPVEASPEMRKIQAVDRRHPIIERLLAGMEYEEVLEWIMEDEPEDSPSVLKLIIIWEWFRRFHAKVPGNFTDEEMDRIWGFAADLCRAHVAEVEEREKAESMGRIARRAMNHMAERGVDVQAYKRKILEALRLGIPPEMIEPPMKEQEPEDEDEES